jgi:hypothetical protein
VGAGEKNYRLAGFSARNYSPGNGLDITASLVGQLDSDFIKVFGPDKVIERNLVGPRAQRVSADLIDVKNFVLAVVVHTISFCSQDFPGSFSSRFMHSTMQRIV